METISGLISIFLIVGIISYILYTNGYMIISSKTAVAFVGTLLGKRNCSIRFSSCNGYVKRVLRFRDDVEVQFAVDGVVTKGKVQVEILDADKRKVLMLEYKHPNGKIIVEKKKKYYLVIRFESATGELGLSWN